MLFIALDEQGEFENYYQKAAQGKREVIFIGGIAYQCDDENELSEERKRIDEYYKKVFGAAIKNKTKNLTYQDVLHSRSDDIFNKLIGRMKKKVEDTIFDFIEKGIYDNQIIISQRKGKYFPIIFMKSDKDKDYILQTKNALIKDDLSSNLYYHMVRDMLGRVLTQCDTFDGENKYYFDIASRSTTDLTQAQISEYKKIGYDISRKNKNGKTISFVKLTNDDVYRTVLKEISDRTRKYDSSVEFQVRSIEYNSSVKNMEFLYLADSICSVCGYEASDWNSVHKKVQKLGKKYFMYAYDPVDDIYSNAYEEARNGNYYTALESMYQIKANNDDIAHYYANCHLVELEDLLQNCIDVSTFTKAVISLEKELSSNSCDNQKTLYIVEKLLKVKDNIANRVSTTEFNSIFFKLYSSAMTIYNHNGMNIESDKMFVEAEKYKQYASLIDYLSMRNRRVVFLTDSFRYTEAKAEAEENCRYQVAASKLHQNVVGDNNVLNTERNKTRSQLGQVYAFLRDDSAEKEFTRAMRGFDKKSANYYITESYLLQFYLDRGYKDKYEKRAKEFFGGHADIKKQLEYIIQIAKEEDPIIHIRFALYLYLKALWLFYTNDITPGLWKRLENLESALIVKGTNYVFRGYPDQLSLKYLVFIFDNANNTKVRDMYQEKLLRLKNDFDGLLRVIYYYGQIQIKQVLNSGINIDSDVDELWNMFTAYNKQLGPVVVSSSRDKLNVVEQYLVYTYV